ncbi:MAG: AzlD domain-containing protein [Alteromonadaceae bacterium]|jgi:branched-subunit amino acid transport protein
MTLLTIVLMAIITFMTRYFFLHPSLPIKLGAKTVKFLSFSAPAVLTAIWVPIIFVREHELILSPTNPYLIGATTAIIFAAKSKNIYLTLSAGMVVFISMKFIFLY